MSGAGAAGGPRPVLFAPGTSRSLGERISGELGVPLSALVERSFEDGEHKTRPHASVRGADVFVIHSLYGERGAPGPGEGGPQGGTAEASGPDPGRPGEESPNDKLCRLLFLIGALRDADAARVTAVVPYLCYARKDRKTKTRDPVTTRYVAQLLEAVGADRVLTLEVHNLAALQNAFRVPTDHLESRRPFADHFAARLADHEIVVVSPDVGGVKRAEGFRETLAAALGREVPSAFMEKHRSAGVVSGERLVGDVEGRVAILFDDLIATGTTMARAARSCRAAGAAGAWAAAAHGLFLPGAEEVVADPALDGVVVTDTVPPFRLPAPLVEARVEVLSVAPLLAEAIRRIHEGGSIVELLYGDPVPD